MQHFLRQERRICLLYTSDAADEEDSVDLGGDRIIKKKDKKNKKKRDKKKNKEDEQEEYEKSRKTERTNKKKNRT